MWPTPAASAPRTPVPVMSRSPTRMRPPVGTRRPGDRLHELGLAVAVHAGDADDLARAHLEREAAQRGQPAVVHRLEVLHARAAGSPVSAASLSSRNSTSRPTISLARLASVAPLVSTVPTFLPRRSTVTRSAISSTSRSLWEMKMTETPSAVSERRTLSSSAVSWAVSTAVGSSRIRTSAPRCSTRRISTRCCWPTPMSSTRARGSTASPNGPPARARAARRSPTSSSAPLRGSEASTTFSATLMTGMSMKCWCTMPIRSPIACRGEAICTASPRRRISPSSGWWSP